MRQVILLILIGLSYLLFCSSAFAVEPRYLIHTSAKDIEFKKKKALNWYKDNVDDKKFYGYDPIKHVNLLKAKTFRWYEDKITKNKFYFVNAEHELTSTKKKALRWYDRNNK